MSEEMQDKVKSALADGKPKTMGQIATSVRSADFVELWVAALKAGITRTEFYKKVVAKYPHLVDDDGGYTKVKAKMYAINASIKKSADGKGLKYPHDPDSKRGVRAGGFKKFIEENKQEWLAFME